MPQLLSDPFLQLPTETSVQVVWFTEFAGLRHSVAYGEGLHQIAIATTTKLSRTREDQISRVKDQTQTGQVYKKPTWRDIWRHEAKVTNLSSGVRVPYCVTSVQEDGIDVTSAEFTLAPKPHPGTSLKILLTSDHQLKPMIAANLQLVVETVGRVDAVFFAGDLVNVPDRASEWFDDNRGGAFFPCLQGRGHYELEKNGVKTLYRGGELIQNAPLFTAIGNHEVMGRFSMNTNLNNELDDTIPRANARQLSQQNFGKGELESILPIDERWLKDNSFNTDTYEEIFTLPKSSLGGNKYYAISFGDVRLVVLFAANAWRTPSLAAAVKGRYSEREEDLTNPLQWGYGQHIFEPIAKGSVQYSWLQQELNSPESRQAKYKVVMLHHPPHSLGDNVVPAYTDPVQVIDRDTNGSIKAVRYQYPLDADYIIQDVVPLLEASGVQLVLYGHCHLWNRFVSPSGMNFLETSNVGNSYGAAIGNRGRNVTVDSREDYVAMGDPHGLEPVMPTIAPLLDEDGEPMPYIASNDITVFSIFETATGTVSSYRFNTQEPGSTFSRREPPGAALTSSKVVKFDEFKLSF